MRRQFICAINDMASLTAYEQLLLELVNRARLDPAGEALRYGISLNQDLPPGTLIGTVRQPLAPNTFLRDAAHRHSDWMLNHDTFSHMGAGNSFSWDRMSAAGYEFNGTWNAGENIAYIGTAGAPNLEAYTHRLHQNLFLSPDHRFMMLKNEFREMGPGIAAGWFTESGSTYNTVMATENFAQSGDEVFISGVAIYDRDGDNFYDVGEGRGGIGVNISSGNQSLGSTTSAAAGGYAIKYEGGPVDVTFSGGTLNHSVNAKVLAGALSAKIDLSGSDKLLSSATTILGDGATKLLLLGAAPISGFGNEHDNVLIGNRGNNRLDGAGGNDIVVGGQGRDVLKGGDGSDRFDFNRSIETSYKFAAADHIVDFVHDADVIDLSTIDANSKLAGDQSFKWIGASGFHHIAGELQYVRSAGGAIVAGDTNGDGSADFRIMIDDVFVLGKLDFVL